MTSIFSKARSMTGLGHMTRGITARSAAVAAAVLIAGCSDSLSVTGGPTPIDPLFRNYVALGNSITAGYQSGGISDSTQRESYARLFAIQVNTRYAYASFYGAGCPAPIDTFPATRPDTTSCRFRTPTTLTSRLNNVAVPGANSLDPISASTAASNPLTTFILGGETQVQKAAETEPTFVSVWIGNNDVLPAALSGVLTPTASVSPGITPIDTFKARYQKMIDGLRAIPSLKGGVLIGVVQVTAAPALVPATALSLPGFGVALGVYAGTPITVYPNCFSTGSSSLISLQIIGAIRNGFPSTISCEPGASADPRVGEVFILTAAEQATLQATVTSYNTFIHSVADSLGWAYYDPNTTLVRLKTSGCIASIPNLADRVNTFGPCVSLDGVHPSGRSHKEIANDLITAVNTKYSTSIPLVNVSSPP